MRKHPLAGPFLVYLFVTVLCAADFAGDTDKDRARIAARRNWWAFQPVTRPAVPKLNSAWPRTPIDALLLPAMQAKGVAPSAPETRARLIRRVTLDLTGLPPSSEDVNRFLADRRTDAYERLVDTLLASPQYGERWAQRWLDVVRYADTNGFELDAERPHAWRYRDYVVNSFNTGKPYDRFLREQIAGDEIWPGNPEAAIAVGMLRAGPEHVVGGNQDAEMNRQEVLIEMTGGVSSAFLGLTMNCARCHNHKFDPILQSDYYRMQAVFAPAIGKDIPIATDAERTRIEEAKRAHAARIQPITGKIAAIEKPYKDRLTAEKKSRLEPALRALLDQPKDSLSPADREKQRNAREQITPSWDEVLAELSPEDRTRRTALRQQLHAINLDEPEPVPAAYALENTAEPAETHILKIGDHRMKLGAVQPGLPLILANHATVPSTSTGRRRALAEWLADPAHPLTARVMVNRIWQFRMGTALVATPNDYGLLGSRPTNPKLLDWLAAEFVASGWNVKAIDRLVVTSAAYRQSSARDAVRDRLDPDNTTYWRMNKRRLEGEAIRDAVLFASGKLNPAMGGRPVRVPIEKEIYDLIFTEYEADNLWPLPKDRSEIYRRSLYLLNKRSVRLPMLQNFDQPDTLSSCAVRPVSTHALQALSMLNSDFMAEQAAAFAARAGTVPRAYQLALSRLPRPEEQKQAAAFLAAGGTLSEFCLALLNRNEFVYIP
ncbi:MAG: DUF1553 domain-containing protein [Bryobacterales bacterium]|nr:DUF1553 domain-containing protein [Bryobacterales bacterium]